jgi:hypothetical protein
MGLAQDHDELRALLLTVLSLRVLQETLLLISSANTLKKNRDLALGVVYFMTLLVPQTIYCRMV